MSDTCARIQELLSAYLDGRLSPDEAARVAAHLETCPECAALLEKMRQLDGIAASAMDDIDDAVLEKLEQRIRADIDRLPTVNIEEKLKVGRVIPIWYRYVAVAASVVLVFMIGRAFYKGGGLDEWIPGHQNRTVPMSRPPVQGAQPPASIRIKPASETPPEPAETKAIDQSAVVHPELDRPTQEVSRKVGIPEPVPEAKTDAAAVEHESRDEMVSPPEDVRIATQAELKDISRDKETARSDYQETNKSIVVVPEEASRTKESQSRVATGGEMVERSSSEPDTRDSVAMKVRYLPVPPVDYGQADISKSIVVAGETRREDTSSTSRRDAGSQMAKKADELRKDAVRKLGELGYNNAIAPPAPSRQKAATLQSRYAAALAEYKPVSGIVGGFAAKPKGGDSTAAVRFVLGRADDMPETSDLDNQATKLYLTARADYDLYRFTGERSYYDRAVSARDSLMRLLDRFAGDPQKAEAAEAYRKELQQFQCQE